MRNFIWVPCAILILAIGGYFIISPSPKVDLAFRKNQNYLRIVSLAPSYTEVVDALGEAHRLVGVTTHCRLKDITKIGSFAEANFEGILRLKPDLVLAVPHVMVQGVLNMLAAEGIDIYAEQPDSLADIKKINKDVATLLGVKHRGMELNRRLNAAIYDAKLSIAEKLKFRKDKRVVVAVSHSPLVVAGPHTFPAEIIEGIGLINLAAGVGPWPVWSLEALLFLTPSIFIIAGGKEQQNNYQKLFSTLGVDLRDLGITIVIPEEPIFTSPSPVLIEDTRRLMALFNETL